MLRCLLQNSSLFGRIWLPVLRVFTRRLGPRTSRTWNEFSESAAAPRLCRSGKNSRQNEATTNDRLFGQNPQAARTSGLTAKPAVDAAGFVTTPSKVSDRGCL